MLKKEYSHLVKPMLVKPGPPGLYPAPRVFMEGRDLEGFEANFSFGYFTKPQVFHPVEGSIIHPYDECLIFEGTDTSDILKPIGAEVSIALGEEQEEYTFNEPTVVLVPKGTPHGPVTIQNVTRPIAHYHIGLAPDYKDSRVTVSNSKSRGSKYAHLIRKMVTAPPPAPQGSKEGEGYETSRYKNVTDYRGIMRPAEAGVGPGNGDQIVWLYGKDLEGFNVNFTWGFYSRCGKWHRGGEAHTHPEAEILCFAGFDPDNPEFLGAELELGMGKDYERHIFNKSTVAICPAGFPHLPLITRWVDKPYAFFVICLSGEHASPWVEA